MLAALWLVGNPARRKDHYRYRVLANFIDKFSTGMSPLYQVSVFFNDEIPPLTVAIFVFFAQEDALFQASRWTIGRPKATRGITACPIPQAAASRRSGVLQQQGAVLAAVWKETHYDPHRRPTHGVSAGPNRKWQPSRTLMMKKKKMLSTLEQRKGTMTRTETITPPGAWPAWASCSGQAGPSV